MSSVTDTNSGRRLEDKTAVIFGAQIGIDLLSGGSFYADPLGWVLDDTVPVTNPTFSSSANPAAANPPR